MNSQDRFPEAICKPIEGLGISPEDLELISQAAKAAVSTGLRLEFVDGHWYGETCDAYWNPLEDDGDAFRLAFALKVPIWYWRNGTIESMRRAIVSIAAKGPFL